MDVTPTEYRNTISPPLGGYHYAMGGDLMETIHIMDNKNYDPKWPKYFREAVRAVIIKDGLIALVKSKTDGFFKFPGGGIKENENHIDTLVREAIEETGLNIIPQSITELGMIQEIRKGINDNEIFEQKSYYYYADVDNKISNQNLDEYEKDLGFELCWTDIETAYHANMKLVTNGVISFLQREAFVLNYLFLKQ